MPHVNFTQQIDIPEVLFILFLLFFLGLVYHIRGEDKREGYPLESDRTDNSGGRVAVVGFPPMPKPKVFLRKFGEPVLAPGPRRERDLTGLLVPLHNFYGSPATRWSTASARPPTSSRKRCRTGCGTASPTSSHCASCPSTRSRGLRRARSAWTW